MLLLVVCSYFAPDLSRLGADDWTIRERETARCDNLLLALLLPRSHDDPEVNHRVQSLRTRNLRWLRPLYLERLAFRHDLAAWARAFVLTGRSQLAHEYGTFEEIHIRNGDINAASLAALLGVMPLIDKPAGPAFLYGSIRPGEWERYLDWLDFHQRVAPVPCEVVPGAP